MRHAGAYSDRLACLRCGTEVDARQSATPCPRCAVDGFSVACLPVYDLTRTGEWKPDDSLPGVFRYPTLLPVDIAGTLVSLQEGGTPLVRCDALAEHLGVGALYVKDETRNPTWSYKDRLAAVAVTQARQTNSRGVVVASTGNHGAAVAAYAAAAGLPCIVLTIESVPREMKVLMQAVGAKVVALRTGPERWQVMERLVADRGWAPMSGYVDPPLGSNPFGVEGYKSIAYEVVEHLGHVPDFCVVPTAYGDGIAGVTRGFLELQTLGVTDAVPRMVAADPLGAYAAARHQGFGTRVAVAPTVAFSTGTPVATYQGIWAMERTGGTAPPAVPDADILAVQLVAARTTGLYLEGSSVVALAGIRALSDGGVISGSDTVVAIGTSTGVKDTSATGSVLPAVPVIAPDLAELDAALALSPSGEAGGSP